MKPCDYEMYENVFPGWAEQVRGQVHRILLLSCNGEQFSLFKRLFPNAEIVIWGKNEWDLNKDYPTSDKWDLVACMNTFMCATDPDDWFRKIFAVTKYFWMQELIRARRDGESECAVHDGDVMRFSFPPHQLARIPNAYDITKLKDRTKDIVDYHSTGHDDARSFLIFLEGDLCYNPAHGNQTNLEVSGSDPSPGHGVSSGPFDGGVQKSGDGHDGHPVEKRQGRRSRR